MSKKPLYFYNTFFARYYPNTSCTPMAAGAVGFILLITLILTTGNRHPITVPSFSLSSPRATLRSFQEALKDDRTLAYAYRCLSKSMQQHYPYYAGFYPFFSRIHEGILLRKVFLGSQIVEMRQVPPHAYATATYRHLYSSQIPLALRETRYIDPQTGDAIHDREWKINLNISYYATDLQRWYQTLSPKQKEDIDRISFREWAAWDTFRHRR